MTSSISCRLLLCALLIAPSYAAAFSVTFVNPGKKGERFWDMVTETMQAAAEDFQIDLEVVYAQRNRIRMTRLGTRVVQRRNPPDYLILVNEEQAAEKIVSAANAHRIPTLMLLNDLQPDQYQRLNTHGNLIGAITPDNFGAGRRMMEALLKCARDKNPSPPYHLLALGGDPLTPASIERNQGAMSVVEEHQEELILDRFLFANWNRREAEMATSSYLDWASRNKITPAAIWSANDPMAFGAMAALKTQNLTPGSDVCVAGLNWSARALQMIKQGELLMTDGGHFLAGAWAMVLLYDHHIQQQQGHNTRIGHIRFPMHSLNAQNADQYLKKLGDENWRKINFKRFTMNGSSGRSTYDFSLFHVLKDIKH